MKIAIIDRFPIILKGLKVLIYDNFSNVSLVESHSIVDFCNKYPDYKPDLFIISVSQSQTAEYMDIINFNRKSYGLNKVILLGENANLSIISQYFKAGVQGYVSKESSLDELHSCINYVLAGKRYMDMEIILTSGNYFTDKRPAKNRARLTARQYQIAVYLSEGRKNSWIAQKLAKKPSTISTVKKNIFTRLAIENILTLREMIQSNQLD